MCQFNYTIIKNKESVSYLTKHGYGCLHTFPNGYKAFGGNRPGFCDCGSMVGSHSLTFHEEGKYPFQLSAADYWRAVKKQSDLWEESRKRMKSPDFHVELQKYDEAWEKINTQLRILKENETLKAFSGDNSSRGSSPENASAKEYSSEENELIKQRDALMASKDAAFFEAKTALFLEANSIVKRVTPEVNKFKSPNYNMQEFRYYRRMFKRLLEFEPYVCFTHIFDEPGNLTLVKTLRLSELKIGDLAMLAKDDVIQISL